ncbi:MAG: hypothetical protein HQL88_04490, partial [Magnetococcales bacterium]|nr:hypothetical protein [Magnetococcales bacterium]
MKSHATLSSARRLLRQSPARVLLSCVFLLALAACTGGPMAPARQADGQAMPGMAEQERPPQEAEHRVEPVDNSRAILSDMQRRLAAQEAETRMLRGNLEVVQHENQKLKEQVREKVVSESVVEPPPPAAQAIPMPAAPAAAQPAAPVPVAQPAAPPTAPSVAA